MSPASQRDIEQANVAQKQFGQAIRRFMRDRTAVESPMLDVGAKLIYGNYGSTHAIPTLLDLLDARSTPEELAQRLKALGVPLGMVMHGLAWEYSFGRLKRYLDAGWPDDPNAAPEGADHAGRVMNWWARAMRVYRNDGGLVLGEDGIPETLPILRSDTVVEIADAALRNGPPRDTKALRRALADLGLYEFVTHAEARDGIHQHGPYELGDNRVLVVQEFTDLQARFLTGITEEHWLPTSRIVVATVLDEVEVRFDLFTVHFLTPDHLDRVTGLHILAGDDLHPITEEELTELAVASRPAQRRFFAVMAGWDDRTKVIHSAPQQANDLIALMLAADYTLDEIDELFVQRFISDAEPYYERAIGPDRHSAFAHVIGDHELILPPIRH